MYCRIITVLTLAVTTLATTAFAAIGQWEDESAITQDPVLQFRSYITTAPDDAVYVLWPDWTNWEDTQVTLMRSTDKGQTWTGPDVILSGMAYDDVNIIAVGDDVHVLVLEFTEDNEFEYKRPYYMRSSDGGTTFTEPIRIGTRDNVEQAWFFAGDDGAIYFYARNYVEEFIDELLYVTTDGGDTWVEKPFPPDMTVQNPGFTVIDGVIHMVYGGFLVSPEILYCRSTDQGGTWSDPVAVSNDGGTHSQLPQIVLDDTAIHVAWEDDRTGYYNIMYTRSTDGGQTWSDDVRLNDTFYGARVKLLTDEEGLHAVWCQYHGDDGWPTSWGSFDYGIIWHKFTGDSGLVWSDEFRVSQNEDIPPIDLPDMGANVVKLAEYNSGYCAMWQDKRDGNIDLYMRNYLVTSPCPADITGDGVVDVLDLLAVLSAWGAGGGDEDITGDGLVDVLDLLEVLSAWGPCE